jgi:hypothetical protein
MNDTTFDYIIIGAGTAGCLLANRLSADASKRVLLIEAGRRDDYHWIHIPVGYLYCISNPRTDWMFKTEAEPGLNGRSLIYPRGKTLGGCSSINGMIYMRGQARDYDGWAAMTGDLQWGWTQSLPYFLLHEDHHQGANALHGARGSAPALMPKMKRPRAMWSNIAELEAMMTGCCCERLVVPVASLMFLVSLISVARNSRLLVMFSERSVRCSPTKASWKPSLSARMMASRSSRRVSVGLRSSGCMGMVK